MRPYERTILTSEEEDAAELAAMFNFRVYPVLVLGLTGGVAHMGFTSNMKIGVSHTRRVTICGRTVDMRRSFKEYENNVMFLRPICRTCQGIVRRMKEANSL